MFKRRVMILSAAAVLVMTGLAGSALADDVPTPSPGKVTCTTSDGKTLEVDEGKPISIDDEGNITEGRVGPPPGAPEGTPEGAELHFQAAEPAEAGATKEFRSEAGGGPMIKKFKEGTEAEAAEPPKGAFTVQCFKKLK